MLMARVDTCNDGNDLNVDVLHMVGRTLGALGRSLMDNILDAHISETNHDPYSPFVADH